MCFEIVYHTEYVTDPDVKTVFEVIDAGGPRPTDDQLRSRVRTAAKLWMANQVVAKAVEVATAHGRVQEVKVPGDVPEMWERGVLFANTAVARHLIDVAHPEVTWADHHTLLDNKAIMLQLKDFSYAAMVSYGPVRDDDSPMGEDVLIRMECRIKFGLEAEQAIIYQLHPGWLELEARKFHTPL